MNPTTAPIRTQADLTQADLERLWRSLMEPLGFSDGSLWLLVIGPDDRPTKLLTQIKDEGRAPTPADATKLGKILAMVDDDLDPGSRWAVLRARPGGTPVRAEDRAILKAVVDGCRAADVTLDVPHLATDTELLPVPLDDLVA